MKSASLASALLALSVTAHPGAHHEHLHRRDVVIQTTWVTEFVTVSPTDKPQVIKAEGQNNANPDLWKAPSSTAVAPAPAVTSAAAPEVSAQPDNQKPAPGTNFKENPQSPATGEVFSGDMTFFDVGVNTGACGLHSSEDEFVVALGADMYGNEANPNQAKNCGRYIIITGPNGKTARARVVDKCPGGECVAGSIDVSKAVFLAIMGSLEAGRVKITWVWDS